MTLSSPETVSRTWRPRTWSSPRTSTTWVFQANWILSLSKALCCMIFEARSESRRCTIVTDEAKRVRNKASSRAESPPPTTAMSWPRKKNPSQVAHVESPWLSSRSSPGTPIISDCAPVARMTVSAVMLGSTSSVTQARKGRDVTSRRCTFETRRSAPNRSAWARMFAMSSGPVIPWGNPGKFSMSVVSINCPPGWSVVDEGSPSMTMGWSCARAT